MARKTLLTEAEIRRFMKLAELNPLTENFFDKQDTLEEEAEEHVYELDKAGKTGIELTNFVEIWKFKNGEWE